MTKTRYYIFSLIAFAASALIGGHFLMRTDAGHKRAGPREKITIAYSTTTDTVLAEVAQMQGFYLQEGLEAIPQKYPYGKIALQAVLEGRADFATVAETPIMFAVLNGEKLYVIATIQTSSKANAIVARKDKGILTPADLKGRTIAATLGTTSEFFMDAYLAGHGIARKNMKVVDLKAEGLSDALENGTVDAVSAFNPYLIRMQKKLGNRVITFYDEEIYTKTFNIVATQEFVRNNPGKVDKVLGALIKAEQFVSRNPAAAQKIVADFSLMDAALVREIWQDTSFLVRLDQSLVLALEEESRWAVKGGLTGNRKIPDYMDYIYLEGLQSVKPTAVRILR